MDITVDVEELLQAKVFDFPAVDEIYYRLPTWEELEGKTLSNSNMDFFGHLNQKSLTATLDAFRLAPEAHPEDFDIWVLFCCYQYIVWSNLGNWKKDDMLKAAKRLFWHNEKEISNASQDDFFYFISENQDISDLHDDNEDCIVFYLMNHFIDRLKAQPYFSLTTDLRIEHQCTLCKTAHEAMLYQLLLLTSCPIQAKDGNYIARCKQCGNYFVAKSRKYKYCEKCGSGAARQARFKKRKKGNECNYKTVAMVPGDCSSKTD